MQSGSAFLKNEGVPEDEKLVAGTLAEGPWNDRAVCKGDMPLVESGFEPIKVCLAGFSATHDDKPCVAYDLGVRDIADFALAMIEERGCSVRAYDPSQVTAAWWAQDKSASDFATMDDPKVAKLKEYEQKGQYKLRLEAAGDKDGELTLYQYGWSQVSNFKATDATAEKQQEFHVPSKTLATMMKENGDDHIDFLKVDIEGSEFGFLNEAFDQGCPNIEHMLMEWHSQNMDETYGAPPEVKALEEKFEKCGYKKYDFYPFFVGQPTEEEDFDVHSTWFGHAAYCRNCVEEKSEESSLMEKPSHLKKPVKKGPNAASSMPPEKFQKMMADKKNQMRKIRKGVQRGNIQHRH